MALEGSSVLIQREKKKRTFSFFVRAARFFFCFRCSLPCFFFSSVCTHACVYVSVFLVFASLSNREKKRKQTNKQQQKEIRVFFSSVAELGMSGAKC